jgi:hypothetical protein
VNTYLFQVLRGYHDGLYRKSYSKNIWSVVQFLWSGTFKVARPDRCKKSVQVFSNLADAQETISRQDRESRAQLV